MNTSFRFTDLNEVFPSSPRGGKEFDIDPSMNPFYSKMNTSDPFFGSAEESFSQGLCRRPSPEDDPVEPPPTPSHGMFKKEGPQKEIFFSPDAFESSREEASYQSLSENPSFGRSPSRKAIVDRLAEERMLLLEKATAISSAKINTTIVSKLPSQVQRTDSTSSRTSAARCPPVIIGRETLDDFNSDFDVNPFRSEEATIKQTTPSSQHSPMSRKDMSEQSPKSRVGRGLETTKSESNKEARLRSISRTKSRMSMSPKQRSQRTGEHPLSSGQTQSRKRSGLPAIPLPPMSSPEDQGRHRKKSSHASKPIRTMSPRTCSKVRSLSPASSSTRNRSEPPSPAKTHLLVQSHSKRIRSQSPRVSRGIVNPAPTGVSARSPGCGKKKALNIVVQHGTPSTPKSKRKSKSAGSKDDGFAVVWQRSPDGSTVSNKENGKRVPRPASLSPVTAQRRMVGGASSRIRALEKSPSRYYKHVEEERSSRGRRDQRKGQEPKHRGDSLPRSQSGGLLAKKGKELAVSQSSHCGADRFSATSTPREADFPPLSPLRKLSTKAATMSIPSLPGSLPFQADVARPRNTIKAMVASPPRPSRHARRRSCA